jgi:phosphatidylglycerophosphate synthase
MDAPARWLDPPIENAIVTKLAPTRVTPNQVTIACTLLGFLAAWLLWHGNFGLALPLMYLVGWLDGVDGKLARLRLHYSPLGAGESYFDFAYENAWWIALTAALSHAGHADAVAWGAALVGGNFLDEIAYTIGHARLGIALDLLSRGDGAFRLIAGRRNVYAAILLVATLLGSPFAGLASMGAWAVVTGVVHSLRLVLALRTPTRGELPA